MECALNGGQFQAAVLLGVLILVLRGAEIAERGVEPAGVVDLIDKSWKVGGHVFEDVVFHQVDGLDLQRLHTAGSTAPAKSWPISG